MPNSVTPESPNATEALIPLTNTSNGIQAVRGRDLHKFLEVQSHYRDWMPRMIDYGFEEGKDYALKNERVHDSLGRERDATGHIITLDMAKEISMIQRTDKGKQARQYFIECEKRLKEAAQLSGPELMARAVLEAQNTIAKLEKKTAEMEPKAKSWEFLAGPGGDYGVAEAAKVLSRDPNINIGRNRLFSFMAELGWTFRTKGKRPHPEAYQSQIENGRLKHKLSSPFFNERTDEWEQPAPTIRITPKGLHELHKKLGGSRQIQLEGVA